MKVFVFFAVIAAASAITVKPAMEGHVWGSIFAEPRVSGAEFGRRVECSSALGVCAVGSSSMMTSTMNADGTYPNAHVDIITRMDASWRLVNAVSEPPMPDGSVTTTGFGEQLAWDDASRRLLVSAPWDPRGPRIYVYELDTDLAHFTMVQEIGLYSAHSPESITVKHGMLLLRSMSWMAVYVSTDNGPFRFITEYMADGSINLPNGEPFWGPMKCQPTPEGTLRCLATGNELAVLHFSVVVNTDTTSSGAAGGSLELMDMQPVPAPPMGPDGTMNMYLGEDLVFDGNCFVVYSMTINSPVHQYCIDTTGAYTHKRSVYADMSQMGTAQMEQTSVIDYINGFLVTMTYRYEMMNVVAWVKVVALDHSKEDVTFPFPDNMHFEMSMAMMNWQSTSILNGALVIGQPTAQQRHADGMHDYYVGAVRYIDDAFTRPTPTPYYCHDSPSRVAHGVRYFPSIGCFADQYCSMELHGYCDGRDPDLNINGKGWYCRQHTDGMMQAPFGECPAMEA